ncbi:MAG: type II secretion system protein [Clostridia bacterium]|nr:type II secretion system protein [Clostridia bacterium]
MKTQKGYSMVVLVIAITVILILVSSAVSVLQVSREKTNITNFIFDITTVEEEIQDFYTSTGTLPISKPVDINDLNTGDSVGILSQLHIYDNENYYEVDLSKLGTITLKDSERNYIVNEGSLKVYVKNGVEYRSLDENVEKTTYYTLTSDLINGLEPYVPQGEEMLVLGNPVTWVSEADLKLVLPRKSLEETGNDSWKDWTFKWDFGPKTEEELANISASDSVRNFKYGDLLNVKSNGIYSIYAKDPTNKVTVLNVNVTKIDDIKPTYKMVENSGKTVIQAMDNETGIKTIKYKTLQNYKENKVEAENAPDGDLDGRTNIDFYLVDGPGKDVIYQLASEIADYKMQRDTIKKAISDENKRYDDWKEENDMKLFTEEEKDNAENNHNNTIAEFQNQLETLNAKYPYLYDIHGTTDASRIVIYIEDYSSNATVIGENDFISTEILANSYNISLAGL